MQMTWVNSMHGVYASVHEEESGKLLKLAMHLVGAYTEKVIHFP